MEYNYDLIVIGAGPGGYVAAIRAAQAGMKTALIERDQIGGTCLNRGCIPTKTLMHSSHLYREMLNCEEFGIQVEGVSFDIADLYQRKDQVVTKLRDGIEFLLKANKVEIITGVGQITAKNQVTVTADSGQQVFSAANLLIAAGAVPVRPLIDGIDSAGVLTSDELLAGPGKTYQNLVIIGGGVIGVEFATIFQELGTAVTIIEATERILPTMDREISQNLTMIMKKRKIAVSTAATVEKIERQDGRMLCHYTQKGKSVTIEADAVLAAVGRRPNLAGLFSKDLDIQVNRGIVVNQHFETSIPSIYAIGDVISGAVQLAHIASAQAGVAVAHMNHKASEIDLNTVPACVYTNPEIASTGLDAATAKARGIAVKSGKFSMAGNGKSIIENQDRGFIKLVFEEQSEVIVGAQLMCARATDLISELSNAIVNRQTVSQVLAVIRPHPTFTEGVTEAAEDLLGLAVHIAPKKK